MKVRSGTSYWRAVGAESISFPELAGDAECEVLVVGGGITGALVSHYLLREGVQTMLIDKRDPGVGSTAASTGLLQYEVDTPLSELISKVGEAAAVHAYRRGVTAIDELEAIVGELAQPCGFSRKQSLYYAGRCWHERRLRKEYECRKQFGFDVEFLSSEQVTEVSSIRAPCGLMSSGDAQINPYEFTQRLLQRNSATGVLVHGNTELKSLEATASGVVATTSRGKITATRVVFATGYESAKFLKRPVGSLLSTYALASEPVSSFEGWPRDCLVWETSRPYFYARQTDDHRAIIGGQDTAYSDDHKDEQLTERQFARLEKQFAKLFPAIKFEAAFRWAGTFGETKDGLAYIGAPPDQPHCYFALGYGGNGITFAMISARLIADLYLRRPNADEQVFSFSR